MYGGKSRIAMMPTLQPPAPTQVVIMTTYGATIDDKFGIITIICAQCIINVTNIWVNFAGKTVLFDL